MWCPNCGKQVSDDASFCMNCGTDLRPFKSASTSASTETITEAMRRAKSFMNLLDQKGLRYEYLHEKEGDKRDGMIRLGYGGGDFSFSSIRVYVDFDYNNNGKGTSVHMWCHVPISFPDDCRSAGLKAINEVSMRKRFVRFYLDRDNDLTADMDFWIGADSAAERALDELNIFVNVIDSTYPDFQKARWN